MGITYQCDRAKNTIFIVWDGEVTADEWLAQAHKLMAEPDWPAITRLITDVGTVSNTASIGDQEIETVAALFRAHSGTTIKKRLAILANDLFGKARKFELQLSRFGLLVVVFNQLQTACLFLNIDPTETEQTLEGLRSKLHGHENKL